MQSTGNEKFTCYVYYKTKLYKPEDEADWAESDLSDCDDDESDESDENEESKS